MVARKTAKTAKKTRAAGKPATRKAAGATKKPVARSSVRSSSKPSSTKALPRKPRSGKALVAKTRIGAARSASRASAPAETAAPADFPVDDADLEGAKRRNSRLAQSLLQMSPLDLENHLEKLREEEVIRLFEESYPSDVVNLCLGLKRATCRRLFDIVTAHRKKAFLDILTLYFYRDYLSNPFPLEVDGQDGSSMTNYYALVGVARDASESEIDSASKLLSRAFRPECFPPGDRKLGDVRGQEIRTAFELLRNRQRRDEVNRRLPSINYYYPKRAQSWVDLVQKYQ